MNALPSLLLFLLLFLYTTHGRRLSNPPALPSSLTSNLKRNSKTSCPEATDIAPCVCSNDVSLLMDCSEVEDEEQLKQVFLANFPSTAFYSFLLTGNTHVTVLEDGVFGDVTFQALDIKNCTLDTVRKDALTSSFSTLHTIQIENSQLSVFPFERLEKFTSLRNLYLRRNQIHSLPSLSSSSLRNLDLSFNSISQLRPEVFSLLASVEQIDLAGNHLTQLQPGIFTALTSLTSLNLSSNSISHLESFTFDLPTSPSRSTLIDLDFNNIDLVDVDAFKGMQGPSIISLIHNALTSLKEEVWRPVLEKSVVLYLEGNSLSCGCNVAWLVRSPSMLSLALGVRCADGTLLTDLTPADFDMCP